MAGYARLYLNCSAQLGCILAISRLKDGRAPRKSSSPAGHRRRWRSGGRSAARAGASPRRRSTRGGACAVETAHVTGVERGLPLRTRRWAKSSATWSTQLSPHLGGGAGRAASSAGSEGGRRGGARGGRQRGRRRRRRRRRGRRRPVRRGYSHREALLPCPSLGPAPALRVCTVHLQATQGCEHGLGGVWCVPCVRVHMSEYR